MSTNRMLSLAGPAFVVTALVSVIAFGGSSPDSAASPAEVASFYDSGIWGQALASFLLTASIPFLVVFAIELSGVTSRPGPHPAWSYLLIGGSVLLGATLAVAAMVHFALADAGDNGFSPTVLQALNVLDGNTWVAFNTGLGVTMLGAAGCLWRAAGTERWLGRLALVLGVLLFVPYADFFALLVSLIWIVVVGVLRARAPRPGHVAAPATA